MATWVIAFWAFVPLFSSEYAEVLFQFFYSNEWLPALFTEMWESKCKFSTKWISTFCTFVHYLSSVDITCVLRLAASANDFLQLEQVLALVPLWVSMCVYRVPAWPNNFRQWSQVYAFVLLWVTIRLSRPGPWNRVARVACPEDQRHLGGPKSWTTKKLNSRRS